MLCNCTAKTVEVYILFKYDEPSQCLMWPIFSINKDMTHETWSPQKSFNWGWFCFVFLFFLNLSSFLDLHFPTCKVSQVLFAFWMDACLSCHLGFSPMELFQLFLQTDMHVRDKILLLFDSWQVALEENIPSITGGMRT